MDVKNVSISALSRFCHNEIVGVVNGRPVAMEGSSRDQVESDDTVPSPRLVADDAANADRRRGRLTADCTDDRPVGASSI